MANTSAVFSPTAFNLKAFSNTAFNFGSRITIFVPLQGNAWLPPRRKKSEQDRYIKVIEPQELEPDERLEALQKQDEELFMLIADAVARFVNGR